MELDEFLTVLRRHGVAEYEDSLCKVKLGPAPAEPDVVVHAESDREPAPTGFRHPSLWPGGKPLEFPKSPPK